MEDKSNAFLEQEKISVLMRKFAIPCIISLLIAALYNIVDQIFIANADYLGSCGNAANNVVFPLTVVALAVVGIVMKFFQIVISVSAGLAAGCIPIVGYNIGAGRMDRALLLFRKLLAAEFLAC